MRLPRTTIGDFLLEDIVSEQPTSTLWEAKDPQTGASFVLKVPKLNCPQVSSELSILHTLSHSSIIPVAEITTPNGPGLAMPFAFGGDLLSWIQANPLDEDTVKDIAFRVLNALKYLHSQRIWHRDIKPDNLLVMNHTLSPNCIVLGDFGFAGRFPDGVCNDSFPGSLHYAAPELLEGEPYTEKVDIWALGMTVYVALTGSWPFATSDRDGIREEILNGLPGLFEEEGALQVSEECEDLIDWMLTPDLKQRPSAEEAMEHRWFKGMGKCKRCLSLRETENRIKSPLEVY
jgi:serine/threonine protein kinase